MSTINLTARELELLRAVMEVMKAEIKWTEVAQIAHFNTAKQARDKWPTVRRKLIEANNASVDNAGATTPGSSKPKKTPGSGKRSRSEADVEEGTPSKDAKKLKGKRADTPFVDEDDEEAKIDVKMKFELSDHEDEEGELL